ncbi:hypothetical protein WCX49_00360 [Sulfurimonas sp. HSL-1656]|uniref:hypothetical protein n=1 Tax=Thiomicrolovo subterrani TaxID=3131934 RepID=UPI0031F8AD8D
MRYFLTILALCTALLAAEAEEIDAMIDAVINAPKAERFEKMNAFKLKMRELNQQQRSEALEALQHRMQMEGAAVAAEPKPDGNEAAIQQQMRQQLKTQQQMQQMQQQQMQPRAGQPGR